MAVLHLKNRVRLLRIARLLTVVVGCCAIWRLIRSADLATMLSLCHCLEATLLARYLKDSSFVLSLGRCHGLLELFLRAQLSASFAQRRFKERISP